MLLILVRDNLLGLFIEYMDLIDVECESNLVARSRCGAGIHSSSDGELLQIKVQVNFCTKQLVNSDG